jgi:hypothetical protein
MTILENSLFLLPSILFFLASLGLLTLSHVTRKYEYAAFGFGAGLAGFGLFLFLAILKKDMFVLSDRVDYGANYIFTLSVMAIAIVASIGLVMFLRHRVISLMFIQLGLFFSGSLVLVTFGSSLFQSLANRRQEATSQSKSKFLKAEDFQKGNPSPEWSKAKSKTDSSVVR